MGHIGWTIMAVIAVVWLAVVILYLAAPWGSGRKH